MRYIFVLLSFGLYVFASNLLTYNVYERSDRIDIMLSFDAPYGGKIFQKKAKGATSLTMEGLSFEKPMSKSINSPIVQEFSITSSKNTTVLSLKSDKPIGVFASKTIDGFGLRVRVKLLAPLVSSVKPTPVATDGTSTNLLKLVEPRYLMVLGVMLVLLLFLLWIKSKLKSANKRKKSKNWLFKSGVEDIEILSQKPIDQNNKIVLFSFKGQQYLVLTGNSNMLLDRYDGDRPAGGVKGDDGFKALFEQNKQKLDNYLKLQQSSQLSNYKEKVSQDFPI